MPATLPISSFISASDTTFDKMAKHEEKPSGRVGKRAAPIKDRDKHERLFNKYIVPKFDFIKSLVNHYSSAGSDKEYNYSVVLERFFRYIDRYDETKSLDTWIHICVKNSIYRLNMEYSRERSHITGVEMEQIVRKAPYETADSAFADRPLSETLPDEVYKALLRVPDKILSPLMLYAQGYSIAEIAEIEMGRGNTKGCMYELVKRRIFRARTMLKELLKDYARNRRYVEY